MAVLVANAVILSQLSQPVHRLRDAVRGRVPADPYPHRQQVAAFASICNTLRLRALHLSALPHRWKKNVAGATIQQSSTRDNGRPRQVPRLIRQAELQPKLRVVLRSV
eukprot:scaffold7859_cov391-Pinguiococcus_pyrenoidosus.AAC.2